MVSQFEMMWEGERMVFAKSAKAGHLSRAEAEQRWEEMKTTDNVARDQGGPRGFLRCGIKVRDLLTQVEEVRRTQIASRENNLARARVIKS